tara:strand:+ start:186 stop:332 length:147 start_codon:yes stop_codon:yes gene_type:complete
MIVDDIALHEPLHLTNHEEIVREVNSQTKREGGISILYICIERERERE